jgi:hypothetical protein
MAEEQKNYCSREDAAQLRGKQSDAPTIQLWWLDAIDNLIEQWTGQGYKGKTRTFTFVGMGNSVFRLPSYASTITDITEDGRRLQTREWIHDPASRLVERKLMLVYPVILRAVWFKRSTYRVTYIEPTIDEAPDMYRLVAADCVSKILMFSQKNKDFGIGLTASDSASAGKVSTGSSTSFPASLQEELRRIIRSGLKKTAV